MKTIAAGQILIVIVLGQLLGCGRTSAPIAPDGTSATGSGNAQAPPKERQDGGILEDAGAKIAWGKDDRLSEVDLRSIDVNDTLAQAVSKFDSLTKLTMDASSMTIEGWKAIGQLSQLQQLDLRDCPVDDQQLSAAVTGMPKLRALRLSGKNGQTQVSDQGLAVLRGCPDLKVLALDQLWVGKEGLASMGRLEQLAELYVAGTLVDDEALELIAALPGVRKLRLAQTSISTAGLEQLSSLPLEDLDLSECSQLFDDAMLPLGKIVSLKRLNLWRDALTDEGVAQLQGLTNLEWLNLDNTQLSDAGLKHLQNMSKLTFLHLGSTSVSDAGMPELKNLKSLKDLKVTRTAVTEVGAQIVSEAIPGVEIQLKYVEGQ